MFLLNVEGGRVLLAFGPTKTGFGILGLSFGVGLWALGFVLLGVWVFVGFWANKRVEIWRRVWAFGVLGLLGFWVFGFWAFGL